MVRHCHFKLEVFQETLISTIQAFALLFGKVKDVTSIIEVLLYRSSLSKSAAPSVAFLTDWTIGEVLTSAVKITLVMSLESSHTLMSGLCFDDADRGDSGLIWGISVFIATSI